MRAGQREAASRAIEAEHAQARHQRIGAAGPIDLGRAGARRADEVDLGAPACAGCARGGTGSRAAPRNRDRPSRTSRETAPAPADSAAMSPTPTRLMLAPPSIWPPDRKNASMRPWPAQSKSSRAPSVKGCASRLPRMETRRRPPDRMRARCAALPGIGERAPTATCPRSSSMRGDRRDHDLGGWSLGRGRVKVSVITPDISARSSARRQDRSVGPLLAAARAAQARGAA